MAIPTAYRRTGYYTAPAQAADEIESDLEIRAIDPATGEHVSLGPDDWFDADFAFNQIRRTRTLDWLHSAEVRLRRTTLREQRARLVQRVWIKHDRPEWNAEQAFEAARGEWPKHPALPPHADPRMKRRAWEDARERGQRKNH